MAAGVTVAAVGGGLVTSSVANAELHAYPLRHVDVPIPDWFSVDASDSSQKIAVYQLVGETHRFDVTTGAVDTLPTDYSYTVRGDYGFVLTGETTVKRIHIPTGAVANFDLQHGEWLPNAGTWDTDSAGRYLVYQASHGPMGAVRGFVYDTVARQVMTPDGLGSTHHSLVESISADGSIVRLAEYAPIDNKTREWLFNWASGTGTSVAQPAEYNGSLGPWVVSPDLQWVLFPAVPPAGSIDPAPALFRRNVATGETTRLPVAVGEIEQFGVYNGGRVVYARRVPTDKVHNALQLFTWDGAGEPFLVTRGIDAKPGDLGVDPIYAVNQDATVITFVTFASNLSESAHDPGTPPGTERLLYQATLPPIGTVNQVAIVAPGEKYCVGTVGAAPGDFVGVNITPVLASGPGFGVLHSSDDAAGATSNVNFDSGTIDPNVAFVKVGADGRICFTNSNHSSVHVILDEMIVGAAGTFTKPTAEGAVRLSDTRVGHGGPAVGPSEERCFAAVGATPGDFVGVNVTPVEAAGPGFGTMHASGSPAGPTSTVNFARGSIDPNFAFTEVGADGRICFTNSNHGPVHLVLDELVVGNRAALVRPSTATGNDRSVDTRESHPVGRLGPSGTVCFSVPGASVGDMVGVNITPVLAAGPGFGTLHASAAAAGGTSNVNFASGTIDPNFALAAAGPDAQTCFTNSPHGPIDVVIDAQVIARSSAFRAPTEHGSIRLVDTRMARSY